MKKINLLGKALSIWIFVLVLLAAGCDNADNADIGGAGGESEENTEPKHIKIINMGDVGGAGVRIELSSTVPTEVNPEPEIYALGYPGTLGVAKGVVYLELKKAGGEPWTGTGAYFVTVKDTTGLFYIYMKNDPYPPNETYSNVPKLNISKELTILSLYQFYLK